MKILARWTLNALAALSLLLCVAALVLWVRSGGHDDQVALIQMTQRGAVRQIHSIGSERGLLYYSCYEWLGTPQDMSRPWRVGASSGDPRVGPLPLDNDDFARGSARPLRVAREGAAQFRQFDLATPHWVLAVPAALFPVVIAVVRRRAERRRMHGLCRACGYDLRASPGRCPECGRDGDPLPEAVTEVRG